MAAKTTAKTFLHFQVPADLLEKVDTFRFGNRFATRAAAIISLIENGLKAEQKRAEKP